ncbi:carbohydrate-binding module family 5 protein [Amanita thiersii Skay4041]|uniref:chitinase n=1 Tax=Amanita thiersii Skay4041 TaxID=703135 RepID=A0A2A9NTN2_9AGAR|nr:carbohydrate-binding module family 5 protein [Amanita thiersii Skay4041]
MVPISMQRLFLLIAAALATLITVNATQVMHRPDRYKSPPNRFSIETNPETKIIHKRATSKTSFAYFTNWGIYGANFQPTDIVPSILTHILYSFADVNADAGTISLTDPYADEQKHFPGDSWDEPGTNLYGCLKQLYLLKLQQRNLKVLLSVGGWTYSQAGHFNFVTSSTSRGTFVSSAVKLIEDYGFDGIDIDFEFPTSSALGQGFANLVTELRTALNQLAARKGDSTPYLITAAVSAGSANWANLIVPQMNTALNYWNVMAYDFAGSWLTFADNQANLYGGSRTGFSGDSAITHYLSSGATASKINLGMPLYGRAFENTDGLGRPYSGIGPGTIEAGVYSYKTLPLAGAQVFENTTDVSSYSYDSSKRELVSYDSPNIVKLKAQYISAKGLAGSMFWELSTDKVGSQSLVGTSVSILGNLDQSQNHINYPNSKWDNIRNNMGNGGLPTTTVMPTSSSTSGTSTPTSTSPSGSCTNITPWSSTTTYVGGNKVTYVGHLWTAQWWTLGDIPGGPAGVWVDNGAC